MKPMALVAGFLSVISGTTRAADLCSAAVLHDVASIEDPASMTAKGSTLEAITQYRVEKSWPRASFCQHGGDCYPETIIINGKSITALKLINCSIDRSVSYPEDKETVSYSVILNRGAIPPAILRESDVEHRLLMMGGVSTAAAGNLAAYYVRQPQSACAGIVRSALEGSDEGLDKVRNGGRDADACFVFPWPGNRR